MTPPAEQTAADREHAAEAAVAAKGPGFPEFVCMIALMMALNALAIDSMLPALPAMGEALGVVSENARQWIVTAYLLGFGVAQIVYGPLADRFGRKPILMIGVGVYVAFSLVAMVAPTFETLIIARIGQGLGSAATRVLAVSIVRDRFSGRTMARVMSLSFLVFLGVPILAPSLGQLILLVAPWEGIFAVLAFAGVALMIWTGIRLPETLHPEDRLPIDARRIASAFRAVLTNRQAMGYTLAMAAIQGALFGFINSSQQIFFDVFEAPALFTTVFAVIAGGIALASIVNARIVVRLGSMAMEPMGHIAGTASSIQGFLATIIGSLTGFAIGQQFNGTIVPMTLGFTTCGLIAIGAVLFAERGKLFVPHNAAPAPAE
jgi:DHA1 family bicyclomycin/chloramphenicol resistance-like MFS transporter